MSSKLTSPHSFAYRIKGTHTTCLRNRYIRVSRMRLSTSCSNPSLKSTVPWIPLNSPSARPRISSPKIHPSICVWVDRPSSSRPSNGYLDSWRYGFSGWFYPGQNHEFQVEEHEARWWVGGDVFLPRKGVTVYYRYRGTRM